jgi:hypothetical protein
MRSINISIYLLTNIKHMAKIANVVI